MRTIQYSPQDRPLYILKLGLPMLVWFAGVSGLIWFVWHLIGTPQRNFFGGPGGETPC